MSFLDLARERYSCRSLTPDAIDPSKLDAILEAARVAPTAVNKQPFHIWVVTSDEGVERIGQVTKYTFGARTFIVVGSKPDAAWVRKSDNANFCDVDASIVATHIMLAVTDQGLATTWVGLFDAPLMAQLFPQMQGYHLDAIFPIGAPADDAEPSPRHTERQSLENLVSFI